MKKIFFLLVAATTMMFVKASTPLMSKFPEKYETWINHQQFETGDIEFDFHNFETSFTEQVCGFNSKSCNGSWYGYKISKYLISHRDLFNSSIPFCFSFLESSFKEKKLLQNSIKTFELIYDSKTIQLDELLFISIFDCNKGSNYYSMSFLGYVDKIKFIELSTAENLILQFEVDGKIHKFNLQIPRIYDDTFEIKY